MNLDEHRPRAFHARRHDGACDADRSLLQKHLRWICDSNQSRARHLENSNFICRAETILDGTHDAMIVVALAFKIEHRVNDMFQSLRPGD